MAFPCNQFANEEPEAEPVVKQFVVGTYGVKFPILGKGDVIGGNAQEIYKYLA